MREVERERIKVGREQENKGKIRKEKERRGSEDM